MGSRSRRAMRSAKAAARLRIVRSLAALPCRPSQQRADTRTGAPRRLLCREAGVSPCASARRPSQASRNSSRLTCLHSQGSGRNPRFLTRRRATSRRYSAVDSAARTLPRRRSTSGAAGAVPWPPATSAVHPSGTPRGRVAPALRSAFPPPSARSFHTMNGRDRRVLAVAS